LGVLDSSSFLFLPFGNDLLLVVLVARHNGYLPLYFLGALLGARIGNWSFCGWIWCAAKVSERPQENDEPQTPQLPQEKLSQSTATPLTVTCLAPRPFPFTAAIAAAGAFQYPTLRLLGYVFGARAVLFTLIGLPAIWFGRRILRMANSPEFTRLIVGFSVHIGGTM
jgi:membrane protein YqaA with SNARE-associated domain